MKVAKEFSRFAKSYNQHNIIQSEVAEQLIAYLPKSYYTHILDIGCGRGEVYQNLSKNNIDFSFLSALDISWGMLELHPRDERVTLIEGDFCELDTFSSLTHNSYDIVISASALQWSQDFDTTLKGLALVCTKGYFAIFTSQTFASLHECAGVSSPIHSKEYLQEKIALYFDASFEVVSYKLHFESVYAMLRYIKESGTSGGEQKLSYLQTKRLIAEYPFDYLEFEVLFVRTVQKV